MIWRCRPAAMPLYRVPTPRSRANVNVVPKRPLQKDAKGSAEKGKEKERGGGGGRGRGRWKRPREVGEERGGCDGGGWASTRGVNETERVQAAASLSSISHRKEAMLDRMDLHALKKTSSRRSSPRRQGKRTRRFAHSPLNETTRRYATQTAGSRRRRRTSAKRRNPAPP